MKDRNPTAPQPLPPTPAEIRAALTRQLNAFNESDRVDLARQLELEDDGVTPTEPSANPGVRSIVNEMLDGAARPAPGSMSTGEELFLILRRRAARKQACVILGQRQSRAQALHAVEVVAKKRDRWAAIQQKRKAILLAMREANREAWEFQAAEEAGADLGALALDWPADPGFRGCFETNFHPDGDIGRFLAACVREGFATAREIR
jgi:hypothetical protein